MTTSERPTTPATPRERSPCGVFAIESARSASAIPGASRCKTVRGDLGELLDRRGDLVGLVGNDATLDVVAVRAQQLLEQIAARVVRLAARHTVRHGQNGSIHSLIFSTSSTAKVICLSIAFAMS